MSWTLSGDGRGERGATDKTFFFSDLSFCSGGFVTVGWGTRYCPQDAGPRARARAPSEGNTPPERTE